MNKAKVIAKSAKVGALAAVMTSKGLKKASHAMDKLAVHLHKKSKKSDSCH